MAGYTLIQLAMPRGIEGFAEISIDLAPYLNIHALSSSKSLDMRSAVQAASLRIHQYTQLQNANDVPGSSSTAPPICLRSRVLSSSNGKRGTGGPRMRLAVQHIDKPDLRGTINAMMRLLEEHGLVELQRVGVLSQEGVSTSQEIAAIASIYSIPVHVAAPEVNDPNTMTKACSRGMSLGMDQLALDVQQKATPTDPAWYTAIRFPPCDHMDVIHGHGTIALDFERELATLTQGSPTRPVGVESFPDFVIGDMDNGVTLSGICMAFAGTRTQVLGAAPVSGFWEHASKWYSSDIPPEENYEHKYWEGIDVPMADIPWATFRAPGNLSGVFEVDNNHMYAASIAAREHYGLFLEPEEVVPLAVALYNEEFRRLVAQASQACGEDEPTIGIILRSRRAKRLVPVAPKNC